MKPFFLKTIAIAIQLSLCSIAMSQSMTSVIVSKPGRLSRQADKIGALQHLQVQGTLNSEDLAFLSSMPNLTTLDLSNATFDYMDTSAKQNKNKFIQQGVLNLFGFKNLLYLSLPEKKNFSFYGLEIPNGGLPKLQHLKIPVNSTLTASSQQYFHKIEIFGEARENVKDQNSIFIVTDTLITPSIKEMKCKATNYMLPIKIYAQKENKWILNRWLDGLSPSILTQVDSLGKAVFWQSKLEKITIPSNIKVIPEFCFYECKNLKEVELGQVTEIQQGAFIGSAVTKVVLPASITEISDKSFNASQVNQIIFQGQNSPSLYYINGYGKKDYDTNPTHVYYMGGGLDLSHWKGCDIFIPKGSRSNFAIGIWKELPLKEEGEKSDYVLTIEKAGTLASLLTDEIKNTATSLTIKGLLYDTDLEAFKECPYLRKLDLSQAFVSISPKTLKDQQAERQFLANYLAFVADAASKDAKEQYKRGATNLAKSLGTQMEAMTLKDVATALSASEIKVDSRCWIPGGAFSELKNLQELKLPLLLASVPSIWNISVKNIVLPPSAQSIQQYAFSGCKNLQTINIPSTISYIGKGAFKNCASLKSIDLSQTSVTHILDETFAGTEALEEIRFPATIKKIENGALPKRYNSKELLKLYFKTREVPPRFVVDSNVELHIPKGSRAGWQSSVYTKHIIEE